VPVHFGFRGVAPVTRHTIGGPFPALALALIALCWITLLAGEIGPYGRYLNHGDWTALGLAGSFCAVVPGGGILLPALLYVAGWGVMSAAMMLPTALPLIRLFDRMIASRPNRAALQTLLIAGYLLAWGGFGFAAHILDAGLHALLAGSDWLATHAWLPGFTVLAVAGAFQFSKLKYHCLDACRSSMAFIASHWHGTQPYREAFGLGASHGLYCVGCCWALMLLMFLVGTGSVGWMLGLGLIMAVEKNHWWGRHLAMPLGGTLLTTAALIAALNF
jgi:predicted metal-binding membrane protein